MTEPGTHGPPAPESMSPSSGDRIGRYTLLQPLGEGGMGVVFSARDERLDRRVAVKLLRPSRQAGALAWSERRERLLREAQAMAQLSHPNVVEVFDVGTDADALYIAMELVPGRTLRAWLRERGRRWTETMAMFEQAGRGLAAAHAVELVHRDFKPANVLVDRQERARVLDFGLALPTLGRRNISSSGVQELPMLGDTTTTDRLVTPVTEVGVVMGTPAYMAPEQHVGGEVGPAADQYAFCVAAWEALYGQRPFEGATVVEVAKAKVRGPRPEPPAGVEHPRALHRALARGLAPQPEDRWPSMDALLAEIHALVHPAPNRRWPGLVAGAAALGLVAVMASRREVAPPPCTDASAALDRVWNESRRAAVREALLAAELAYARDTADRVEARLDDYARRWREAHAEVCERSVAGRWEADHRPALDCLDRRLRRLDATLSVLASPREDLVPQAVGLTQGLSSLTRCLGEHPDDSGLELPDDPDRADRVRAVLAELEEVKALLDAGRYDDAHTLAEELLVRAQDLGHQPLTDLVAARVGETLLFVGRLEEAEARMVEAVHRAEAAGHDLHVVLLSTQLMHLVGHRLARPEDGLRWARHGEAALRRVSADPHAEAELRTAVGAVLLEAGRRDEAVAELRRAVALWTAAEGPGFLQTAAAHNNLGIAYYELGRYPEAIEQYEQALRIRQRALGPGHPDIGMVLNNLANARDERGDHDEALALRERVLEIWEQGLGSQHPHVAAALNNLGGSASVLGRHEQALVYYQRALTLREQSLGAEHPEVATTRLNLGGALGQLGRTEEALKMLRRAREGLEATVGEHPWTAIGIGATGEVLAEAQRWSEALVAFEESLAMWTALGDARHPQAAQIRRAMGEVLLELSRPQDARTQLQTALRVQEATAVAPHELALTRFALARALARLGEPSSARALAERARAGWADGPSHTRGHASEVEAWISELDAATDEGER